MNSPLKRQPLSGSGSVPSPTASVGPPVRLHSLTLAMFLVGSAEISAGPMMAYMGSHFGVPAARIAWLPAAYALVYSVTAPLFGPLSDRVGRKTMLLPALSLFGVGQVVIAASSVFALAIFGSCLVGLAAAVVLPNTLALVRDCVDDAEQATAAGRAFRGLTFSFISMPVISALLAHRYDWRAVYVLLAAAALLSALMIAGIRPPFRVAPEDSAYGVLESVRAALRIPSVRPRLLMSLLWLGLCIGNITVLAEVLRRRFHATTEEVGLLVGAFGITTMLGNSLIEGVLRKKSRRRVVTAGIAGTMVGCAIVGVIGSELDALTLLAGFLWALCYGIAGPIHHASLGIAAPQSCGTVYAMQASLLNLGVMLVGFAAGLAFDSWGVEWVVGGTLVGMMLALFAVPRKY